MIRKMKPGLFVKVLVGLATAGLAIYLILFLMDVIKGLGSFGAIWSHWCL